MTIPAMIMLKVSRRLTERRSVMNAIEVVKAVQTGLPAIEWYEKAML